MIRIGTRTSKLAMIQTELVKQKIQEHFPEEKMRENRRPLGTEMLPKGAGFLWLFVGEGMSGFLFCKEASSFP